MLVDGVRLLVLGMGMVFAFLLLLYGCVLLLGQLMARIPLPETISITSSRIKPPVVPRSSASEGEVIAVISAAVREYRDRDR